MSDEHKQAEKVLRWLSRKVKEAVDDAHELSLFPWTTTLVIHNRSNTIQVDSYAGAKGEPAMSPQVKAQIMELLRVSGTASNNLHPSVQGNEEANKSDNNNNDDDDDDEILSYEEKMEEYEVLIEAGIEAEAMAAEEEAAEEEELSEEVKTANLLTNILTDQGNESNVLKDELESRLDALAISDCPKQVFQGEKPTLFSTTSHRSIATPSTTNSTLSQLPVPERLRRSSRQASIAKSAPPTAIPLGASSDSESITNDEPSAVPGPDSPLGEENELVAVGGYQGLLVVNKRFNLLICTECGGGMKPEAVYDHFTKSHPVNVPSFKDVPAKLESRTVHHHMNLGKRPAHLKQLQKKLQDMGITAASGHDISEWLLNFSNSQKKTRYDVVQGLQIRPGCICPCGHANSTTEAFRKHSKCKVFEERACYLQSYHPSNYAEWFEVRPQTTPDVTIIPGVVFTPVEQLFRERQAQLYSLVPLLGVMKDSFLDTEGIDQLLTKYNKISLYNCTNAGANDPVRKRLISLRQDTLFADVELLGKSHSSITYPFIDCSLRTKPAKEFRASPQKKTLRAYVTPQEQFICTLVHHHRTPIKAISSDELLFDLTAEEKLAIEELILALRLKELPECLSPMQRSWACQKMYELLYIFYFPRKDPKYLAGGFKFPLVTFLATSWLTPDGAYKMISNFPPVLAKCQFMMRLVGFHKMMVPLEEMMKLPMTVVKDLPEEEEEEEELDFRPRRRQINLPSVLSSLYDDQPQTEREVATKALVSAIKGFCKEYLTEYELTPFTSCRDLLHKATWVVRNTPRPAVITTIDDAVGTFRYDGQVFTLPQLKATVQREMAHLEESIASGVLIGEDLAALGIDFDLFLVEDSGDETTPGYGIFGKTNNPDSSTLMDAFIKKETFKDLENPKSQRYDEDKVQNWILEVEHAWGLLYPLIHILSGPPARGTEEASFTVCNLSGGRRHLFMADYEGERLLTIRSDYHKGLRTTSLVKEIWRVLPYGLARVLYVLLHLIRPIEMVLACDYIIPEDKVALAAAEYTSGLYVHRGKRWDSGRMSESLKFFFLKNFKCEIGIKAYRHLGIFVQRRELNRLHVEGKKTLMVMAEVMTGHTETTGDMVYARTQGTGTVVYGLRDTHIKTCLVLHKIWGVDSSSGTVKG